MDMRLSGGSVYNYFVDEEEAGLAFAYAVPCGGGFLTFGGNSDVTCGSGIEGELVVVDVNHMVGHPGDIF